MSEETTATWNSLTSWANKNLRTIIGAQWWTRRHENGTFDTDIFRSCGLATSVRPENLNNHVMNLIIYFRLTITVAKSIIIFDLTKNVFFRSVRAERSGPSIFLPGDLENKVCPA